MKPQILRLSDGSQTRVLVAGAGPAVVLLHGVGLRAEAWAPQIAALSPHARVIAPDMPGHGQTDPLPGEPLLPDYVAWAGRVIDALGLQRPSVAGHSMGALIALGLGVERGAGLARVALLNPVFRRTAEARAAVLSRAADIAAGRADPKAPLARWFGEKGQEGLEAQVGRWLGEVSVAGYAAAYRAFALGDETYADRIGQVPCPLLALTGDGDANSTPAMAAAIAAAAPLGRAQVIAGHRHMMNLTAPDAVSSALLAWLSASANFTGTAA